MQTEPTAVYVMTAIVYSRGFTSDSALDQTLSNEADQKIEYVCFSVRPLLHC